MRKKVNEPVKKISWTLDILTALISEHQWLDLVKVQYPKSLALVELMHVLGSNEDYSKPSVKELAAKTGMSVAVVTKGLHQLYEAIWELNHEQPDLFRGKGYPVTFYFSNRYDGGSDYFVLWLEHPVRERERFDWFFIRPRQDAQGYFVDEVSHEYENGRQKLSVFLKAGWYSGYRKMLFEKARLLRLLDINELYGLKDFELDELLVHRVEKDRIGFPESLAYLNKHRLG